MYVMLNWGICVYKYQLMFVVPARVAGLGEVDPEVHDCLRQQDLLLRVVLHEMERPTD